MDFMITTFDQFYFNAGSALLPCTLLSRWGWRVSLEEAREEKGVTRLRLLAGRDIKRRASTPFALTRGAAKCAPYSQQALLLCWP
jgi:hypothetical protein